MWLSFEKCHAFPFLYVRGQVFCYVTVFVFRVNTTVKYKIIAKKYWFFSSHPQLNPPFFPFKINCFAWIYKEASRLSILHFAYSTLILIDVKGSSLYLGECHPRSKFLRTQTYFSLIVFKERGVWFKISNSCVQSSNDPIISNFIILNTLFLIIYP
jgi:hypothetical protein